MKFQPGNKYGGTKPGVSRAVKRKYLKKWEEVFDATDPIKKLTALANDDYAEFLRLGLAAMPKEQQIDLSVQMFDGWSNEELRHFVETGERPE